jgi:hypothetical protein
MIAIALLTSVLCLPAFSPQDEGNYEVVRVVDGRLLIGEIVDHDLDGLTVMSARNGGTYHLAWENLFPGEAERLKTGFGYTVDFSMPTVSADRLLLVNGRQITGRILRRDAREIEIRSRNLTLVFPTTRLAAPPEKVVVEATEVLTPEQYYLERLPQIELEDAMAQFEFAREMEAVSGYEFAKTHLEQARILAVGDDALLKRIDGAMPRIKLAIDHRVETDKIKEIRSLMYRERFAMAEEKLAEFEQMHSDSPIYEDYIKVAEKFEAKREEAMIRFLRRNWHKRAASLLKKKSLDRKAKVEALQNYATTELPQLLREVMAEELAGMKVGVDPSEVDQLWSRRTEQKSKRHQAGFGNGTWILGEAKAQAGLKVEEAEENDGRTEAERELQNRYKRYLENLERSRRASGTNEEVSPEDWWKTASASTRFQWLLAFYAEFSGDFDLVRVNFDKCSTCNGDGYVEITELGSGSKGQNQRRKCPTCHGVLVRRSIFFR